MVEDIVCPICKQNLVINQVSIEDGDEIVEGSLACQDGHSWVIRDGVLNLGSEEQTLGNNWSDYYKNTDYVSLDRKIAEATPEEHKKSYEACKVRILEEVRGKKRILDIATGRGMLLTYLAEYLDDDVQLVCVDLSHEVLKYDRLKVQKINPRLKVNYIACDATHLPFRDHTFHKAISLFGIMNMGDVAGQGVREGVRVAREGLLNAGIVIRDDNPKLPEIYQMLADNNVSIDLDIAKESHAYKLHQCDNSNLVEEEMVYEGIGQPNQLDLIPIEGEWFGTLLYHVSKKNS